MKMATIGRRPVNQLLMSENGLALLKQREGVRLKAYEDQGGTRTIGYGHTSGVRAGEQITLGEADTLLCTDLAIVQKAMDELIRMPLYAYEYDAIASFTYNLGIGALARSDVLRHLNAGDYHRVPADMLGWCNVRGVFNRGVYNRRKSEAAEFAGTPQT